MIQCPECGQEVSSKASVCPKCGVRIAGNVKRCPVCKAYVLMSASECPHCHTQFVVPETVSASSADNGKEDVTPETPTPQRQSSFPWKTAAVVILLVAGCCALYFWIQHEDKEAKADAAFALLERCNDPQNFQDFILHYSDSKHIPAVRERLKALEKEEKEWQQAQKSRRLELMRQFFNSYPTSIHHQEALRIIDSLEWLAASALGTSAAYSDYIAAHDNGDYITQAFAARDSALRCEQKMRNDSIAAANADSLELSTPL